MTIILIAIVIMLFKRPQSNSINNSYWSDDKKAKAFASHLVDHFTLFKSNEDQCAVLQFLHSPCPISMPIKYITANETPNQPGFPI